MIPEKAKGNIGLVIKGFINVPKDDIYTFALCRMTAVRW